MTLIECFTDSHIDNIAACLRLQPDKMIIVGNVDEMRDSVKRYQKLLDKRGQQTDIIMRDTKGKDFSGICAVLTALIRETSSCVIDLTGGDEPVIMAVGAVLAGLDEQKRKAVQVEKIDHNLNAVLDCVNDNRIIPSKEAHLTVEELIALHGGSLHPDAYQPPADCQRCDLVELWNIVSDAPKDWNKAVSFLNEFESRSDSKTHIKLSQADLSGIAAVDQKEPIVRNLLNKLQNRGIISGHLSSHTLEYTYRSPLLRYCMQKAGNVLEVKTLLEGRSVLENNVPFFHDCRMSVSIDWDGIVHESMKQIPETRNEIDVVLMHGMTPLFISCKNGNIGDEELYKLHTVANRFGGPYARKMLIATDLDRKSPTANRAFIQRAWDMDINLITDAAELSQKEWQQVFKHTLQ